MPTTNPRLNITLPREVKTRLAKLRKLTGQPESRWVVMFVEGSVPVMDALIESLAVAKSNPAQAAAIMDALFKDAVSQAKHEQKELRLAIKRADRD